MKAMTARAILAAGIMILASACNPEDSTMVETVTFTAPDGVAIEADVAGSGTTGLVLGHGLKYIDGKDSYRDEVRYLAERGFTALAVSFRGYPSEEIPPMRKGRDLDLLAATKLLEARGCKEVYVLGSSMGGWIALDAAEDLMRMPAFHGLILISAGDPGAADGLGCRKLCVVAGDDPAVLERVRAMHATAAEPKQLVVYDSGGHGQALFKSRRDELLDLIVAFISEENEEEK
jgi:alpha-beta hydrolase superfamily lysophospholipase